MKGLIYACTGLGHRATPLPLLSCNLRAESDVHSWETMIENGARRKTQIPQFLHLTEYVMWRIKDRQELLQNNNGILAPTRRLF